MTSTIDSFKILMDKKKDLEEQIKTEAREVFAAQSKTIFEKHGDIVDSFGWTQYTPYFNDGEPCEFGVNDLFIHAKVDKDSDNYEENNYYEPSESFRSYGTKDNKLARYLYDYEYEYTPYSYRNEPPKSPEIRKESSVREPNDRHEKIVGQVRKYDNPSFDPVYGEAQEEISELFGLLDEKTCRELFGDHVVVIVNAEGVNVEEYDHD